MLHSRNMLNFTSSWFHNLTVHRISVAVLIWVAAFGFLPILLALARGGTLAGIDAVASCDTTVADSMGETIRRVRLALDDFAATKDGVGVVRFLELPLRGKAFGLEPYSSSISFPVAAHYLHTHHRRHGCR